MKSLYNTVFRSGFGRPRRTSARGNVFSAGFSLIEMLIVITIILILAGMAASHYLGSVKRAQEATLKQDLFIMRNAIQQYTLDKEAGPTSLGDLVEAKYLSAIPVDPITKDRSWHTESEQVLLDPLQTTAGITDVHSSSDQVSSVEGTAYNTW